MPIIIRNTALIYSSPHQIFWNASEIFFQMQDNIVYLPYSASINQHPSIKVVMNSIKKKNVIMYFFYGRCIQIFFFGTLLISQLSQKLPFYFCYNLLSYCSCWGVWHFPIYFSHQHKVHTICTHQFFLLQEAHDRCGTHHG